MSTRSRRCLVTCALLLAAAPLAAAPQIDDRSLARIEATGHGKRQSGTGFLIAGGQIVTAYHVVQNAQRIDVRLGSKDYADVEVSALLPDMDIAVLKVPVVAGSPFYRTKDGPTAPAGSSVYVHGMPLGMPNQLLTGHLTQSGYLKGNQWKDRNNSLLFARPNLDVVPIDITGEVGMSGGPVLDEQGVAFGVFSGSLQAGGAGYAWAVPLRYLRTEPMNRIGKPASAMSSWPTFTYLASGRSLLRSMSTNSSAARIATECRQGIDDVETAWHSLFDLANAYHTNYTSIRPNVALVVNNYSQDLQTRVNSFQYLIRAVEPQVQAMDPTQQRYAGAVSQLGTACFSMTSIGQLMSPDLPATTANLAQNKRLITRILALAEEQKQLDAPGQAIARRIAAESARATELRGIVNSLPPDQQLAAVAEMFELIDRGSMGTMSTEQSSYFNRFLRLARTYAEIFENIELHDWEREHQTTTYEDPSGLRVELQGGWLHADRQLRAAVFERDTEPDQSVQFVRMQSPLGSGFGAFGQVEWKRATAPQSTAESNLPSYQGKLNEDFKVMQSEAGTRLQNRRDSTSRIGQDLLLESTSDGKKGGVKFRTYIAHRVSSGGTAVLQCALFATDLTFETCKELVEGMTLPN